MPIEASAGKIIQDSLLSAGKRLSMTCGPLEACTRCAASHSSRARSHQHGLCPCSQALLLAVRCKPSAAAHAVLVSCVVALHVDEEGTRPK